ncbi:MAG: MarR family transcriptional regulator [Clostridiales bacterium]|nr:MarR family transcriptional regulator [Clostridiales bacterium]
MMTEKANQILHAFLKASRQVSVRSQGYLGRMNLTYPQTVTLMILDADGPMPISELAKATGSANSTTSGVVDRLERMDLVQRVRSDQDRRKIFVEVTDHYREVRAETSSYATDRFAQAMKDLSEEEQDAVLKGLNVFADALSK